MNEKNDPVQPKHYTEMAISPLEYIEANEDKRKNGLEDLKKAAWYLNHEIERMERDGGQAF